MGLTETVNGILEETGFGEHLSPDRKREIITVLRLCQEVPDIRELPEPEYIKSKDSKRIYGVYQRYSGIAMDLRNKAGSGGSSSHIRDASAETLARVIMNDASLEVLLDYEALLYGYIDELYAIDRARSKAHFLYSTSFGFHGRDLIDLSTIVRNNDFKRFLLEGAKEYLEYIKKKEESHSNFRLRKGGTVPDFSASVFCYMDLAKAYYFLYELDHDSAFLKLAVDNANRARQKAQLIGFVFKERNIMLLAAIDGLTIGHQRSVTASG